MSLMSYTQRRAVAAVIAGAAILTPATALAASGPAAQTAQTAQARPAVGPVPRGPARVDGNPDHRPGQLLFTGNAGASWVLVRI